MTIGYYFLLGKHFCCVTVVGGRSRVGLHTTYKILDPRKSECRAQNQEDRGCFLFPSYFLLYYSIRCTEQSEDRGDILKDRGHLIFSFPTLYRTVGMRKSTRVQLTPFTRLTNIEYRRKKHDPFLLQSSRSRHHFVQGQ